MQPLVDLHHIAGLTAGSSIELRPGTYHFGPTDHAVDASVGLARHHAEALPFTLTMTADGRVQFAAPKALDRSHDDAIAFEAESVCVDGEPVRFAPDVRGAIIDAGPSRFRVTGGAIDHAFDAPIAVPDRGFTDGADAPDWRGCGPSSADGVQGHPFLAELTDRILRARRAHLTEQWYHHIDHIDLRTASHPYFATVAIAAGDTTWRPRFDDPSRIAGAIASAIAPCRKLPSAPLVADLRQGSLAIIGRRSQRLAVARRLLLTLASSSSVDDLEIAVMANPEHASDWNWVDPLPHAACRSASAAPVLVLDGTDQLDLLDLPDLVVATGGVGAVVLGDDPADIPSCATALLINDDGTASVIDHRTGRTTLRATPIGTPLDMAIVEAQAIRNAPQARDAAGATSSW